MPEWTWHARKQRWELRPQPGENLLCDFCSGTPVVAAFDVIRDVAIQVPNIPASTDDAWAACETCCALVEAEDRDALLERSIRTFFERSGSPRVPQIERELRQYIRQLHAQFFLARRGPAVPERATEPKL